MKFLNLFFTSVRMARSIDYGRFSTDPEYPQTLIRELCEERDAGRIDSLESCGDNTGNMVRRAA